MLLTNDIKSPVGGRFALLFVLGVTAYFVFAWLGVRTGTLLVKPLPAWIAACFVYMRCSKTEWRVVLAFFLSGIGDVMGDLGLFPLQLLFFLAAHLLFAASFARYTVWTTWRTLVSSALLILYLLLVGIKIVPASGGLVMSVMVAAYMVAIACMALLALANGSAAWHYLAPGAVLFVMSDSLIAWNRFVEPLPYRFYLVMTTYYAALGLLALGAGANRIKIDTQPSMYSRHL